MPNLDTPHRLEVVNLWALWIVPFAIMSALVGGCAPPEKPPSHVLLQWLQADGVCREDHATQTGNYTGDFVTWKNNGSGAVSGYGSVTNRDAMTEEAMSAKIKDPFAYRPPFIIVFQDISDTDFKSESLTLHGISEDEKNHLAYKATCKLIVRRRLDHLPTDAERRAWTAADKH
jgi:hypothetical protein